MQLKSFLARLLPTRQARPSYSDAGVQTTLDRDAVISIGGRNYMMSSSLLPAELNSIPPTSTHPRLDSEAITPVANPGRLLSRLHRTVVVGQTRHGDGVEDTPPLPRGWSEQHDRAICMLDARMYSLPAIVSKIRRAYPGLRGVLTPAMVDRRLRVLDQDVEIDYWRAGLSHPVVASASGGTAGAGSQLPSPRALATPTMDSSMAVKENVPIRRSMAKPQPSLPKSTSSYEMESRPGYAF